MSFSPCLMRACQSFCTVIFMCLLLPVRCVRVSRFVQSFLYDYVHDTNIVNIFNISKIFFIFFIFFHTFVHGLSHLYFSLRFFSGLTDIYSTHNNCRIDRHISIIFAFVPAFLTLFCTHFYKQLIINIDSHFL